jgi:hypothetical protein
MRGPGTIALLVTLGLLATSSTAGAVPACADALIADWSDGRIDRVYPLPCYSQAIAALPEDVRNYTTARDDISAALRARLRAETRAQASGSRQMAVRGATERTDGDTPAGGAPALSMPNLSGATGSLPLPLVTGAVLTLLLSIAGSTRMLARRFRHADSTSVLARRLRHGRC